MARLTANNARPGSRYWRNKTDPLVTRFYRGLPCVVCGVTKNTCGHHLVPREWGPGRHDPANIIPLCPSHHCFSNQMAAHSTNAMAVACFVHWLAEYLPRLYEVYEDNLRRRRLAGEKPDYRKAYEYWSHILNDGHTWRALLDECGVWPLDTPTTIEGPEQH